jgi:hypothetical protein
MAVTASGPANLGSHAAIPTKCVSQEMLTLERQIVPHFFDQGPVFKAGSGKVALVNGAAADAR